MQALRPKLWAPLVLVLGGAIAFAASQGAPVEAADHNDPPLRVHSTPTGAPTDDRASDIADVFAFTRGTGSAQTTVLAMSFDGPNAPSALTAVPCDRDVVYQIHITSDGGICPAMVDDGTGTLVACTGADATHPCGQFTPSGGSAMDCEAAHADMHTINVRFAPNGTGSTATCVVQAEFASAPGAAAISATPIAGAVETELTSGSIHMYAGLRDDAFFFDLAGFQQTLAMGSLQFHSIVSTGTADFFAGLNTPVIVFEFPTSAITRATGALPPTGTVFRVWGSTARYLPAAT